MTHTRYGLSILFTLLFLGGCSWFGGDDDEEEIREPAKLISFKNEVNLHKLWSVSIGDGAENKQSKLVPVIRGSRIFASSVDGNIVALNLNSGKKIWKTSLKNLFNDEKIEFDSNTDLIVGGLGSGGDILIASTSSGELVALNQSDGSFAWRAKTTSEVVAPVSISRNLVIVQSIDGKIAAYELLDGNRKWIYSTSVPSLTLRGTATPLVFDKYILAGFANGRVALIGLEDGMLRIEQKVTVPKGDSDLDRLIDVDGAMVLKGSMLYAVSYQGNIVAIDLSSNQILWGKEASSTSGLGSGFGAIYLAHYDGKLEALDMDTGKSIWQVNDLLYRELSTPVGVSSYVAVGDLDGYLHLLAQSDGRFVARRKVDGEPVRVPVVVDGNRLYLMGNSGKLSAFEVR